MTDQMSQDELREHLIELVEIGRVVAIIDKGEVLYFDIDHTDDAQLEQALSVDELKRFWSENRQ